jgi:4-amino-4-deoxy-L-arabinose transferase-like glycosyltransferase
MGWLAAGLYLATPWVVVVGSLAYNDGVVALFLATGLLLLVSPPQAAWRLGLALGLVLGAACGAKLTAIGFVVAPLLMASFVRRSKRAIVRPVTVGWALGMGSLCLASWMLRNGGATGNPFFPFASSLFGTGWWSEEQVAIFRHAHASPYGFAEAASRLWSQWIAFGIGTPDSPREPWSPQWGLLPAVGLLGTLVFLWRRRTIGWWAFSILAVQLLFWLTLTHVQSRFLVPTTVPLAVAGGALLARVPTGVAGRGLRGMAAAFVFMTSLVPAFIYFDEGVIRLPSAVPNGESESIRAPALFAGAIAAATGDLTKQAILAASDDAERNRLAATAPLAFVMNHLLAPTDRVLLVGHATPFWYRRGSDTMTMNTVWDRGVLDAIAAKLPDAPERWAGELRALGYRYVAFDWTMLPNWSEKGWLNPLLTRARLGAFANTMAPRRNGPDGVEIREIMPEAAAGVPR